jgi:hypothetical protein
MNITERNCPGGATCGVEKPTPKISARGSRIICVKYPRMHWFFYHIESGNVFCLISFMLKCKTEDAEVYRYARKASLK